jgi:L-ascorbate metabolism protein UlaG (beta-lactamase superfamily)
MEITFFGHASFLVNTGGKNLVFDPFISPNPNASSINVDEIPADYLLVSHGHGDHVADAEAIGKRTSAKVIGGYEVVTWFEGKGLEGHAMNHGGRWDFDFGSVKLTNAIHSSSFPDGSYGGNVTGFIINSEDKSLYYSGDTALTMDMQLIPRWADLDVAFLCMGDNFTMGVDDALLAAEFIQCDKIIGMHYDTFGFIEIDHEEAINKFKDKGKELILMEIGQTINI